MNASSWVALQPLPCIPTDYIIDESVPLLRNTVSILLLFELCVRPERHMYRVSGLIRVSYTVYKIKQQKYSTEVLHVHFVFCLKMN